MAGRRVPLADVPNAANSPFRGVVPTTTAGKRARSQTVDQRELAYGQPPAKRQIVETEEAQARRHALLRRAGNAQPTPLQRKLEAARDPRIPQRATERPKYNEQNLENIRQWQSHYKKVFPGFVFYLDNVPQEMRAEVLTDIRTLGAREERFFSKSVTHVITTRQIPPAISSSSSEATRSPNGRTLNGNAPLSTINPSILERQQEHNAQQRGRFNFEAAQRRAGSGTQAPQDLRRPTAVDILLRARDMGMKIWALEKLQRIMGTMFDTSTGEGVRQDGNARVGAAATPYGQPDLSTLLQQEKLHGPADRDLTVVPQEMTQFRGFYVYVHDMNEQTKPVMIRDYAKPERKEDGQWPQLRATPAGRCPFVDDQAHVRRLKLQEAKAKQKQLREQAQAALPRTRAALAQQQAERQRIPEQPTERRVLTENNNLALRNVNHAAQQPNDMLAKPLDPPKTIPVKRPMSTDGQNLPPPLFGSAQANLRQLPRFVAGEPVASGVQPSNVTSAIKSQMISSTAAAPGARAGTSREVHQLKRKVLEKNSAPSANSIPSSFMNDIRGAINNDRPAPRKRKAQELTQIDEDMEDAEEDARQQKAKVARKKKQQTEKDLKPGYCENCHDKFNDFEDHVLSKKHRKFATTADNWKELDNLLAQLERI